MKDLRIFSLAISKATICILSLAITASSLFSSDSTYTVVVKDTTIRDQAWKKVVDTLVSVHSAEVVTFKKDLNETLAQLKNQFPRYVCFVAKYQDATKQFVSDVHCLTRQLDSDPYTDVLWGILTGYDAANALRIASCTKPLVVRKVASGTGIALEMCEEGVWYNELKKNSMCKKSPGGKPVLMKGPDDTTKALVDTLNVYHADLFITSGHASERNWQIGYRYKNGQFKSKGGRLTGVDGNGNLFPINSKNPKVYLPIGNCLMGHINGPDAMALAFMNSAGVNQMIGYTVTTWYGYAGWGCMDYFVEQPGRYTFAEAFYANQQALIHRLKTVSLSTQDKRGLLYDRDTLALYGDPAWSARMADHQKAWEQKLTESDGIYTFKIIPCLGEKTFDPINTNGSQRGGRPIFQLLAHRIKNIKLIKGNDLKPVITDNFILVPNPKKCDPKHKYQVVFSAENIR